MKTTSSIKLACALAFSLAANALFLNSNATAQTAANAADWNQQYRDQYEVPRGNYSGRSPYMSGGVEAPAPAAETPRAAKTSCSDPTWGLIRLSKTMPQDITLGS